MTARLSPVAARMEEVVRRNQDAICSALETLEPTARFRSDSWTREEGGGGTSRVLQDGAVFEKAGVNVSVVHGVLSPEAQRSMGGGAGVTDPRFLAVGLSLVLHPHNPFAPTMHANIRYFERGAPEAPAAWWFGGGTDLTPSYLFDEDAVHFHRAFQGVCEAHEAGSYARFKRWCDDYFLIAHRGERRGVGGIFFDDLHDAAPGGSDRLLGFVDRVAGAIPDAYVPLVRKRQDTAFTAAQKQWQALRRGRYVEFNLVYDRGTVFGLKTNGRIESILMSLPLTARWEYDHHPAAGSAEAALVDVLRTPRDWV